MAKEKRTYSASVRTAKSLELKHRPGREERHNYSADYMDAREDFPFSREMIQRLIDWFKED